MDEQPRRAGEGYSTRAGEAAPESLDPFDPAEAEYSADRDGVLTLVCLKCGTEYFYGDTVPPAGLTCEKCGNTVFRSFFSREEEDDVGEDFRDTTDRDLRPDDAEGDVLPGDLLDLEANGG